MSTFSGKIKEIPYVMVDNFDDVHEDCKFFFLSHCHSDHMNGLPAMQNENKFSHIPLYASEISIKILRAMYENFSLELRILSLKNPEIIETPSSSGKENTRLKVTTISADHCPGSVMFLFETDDKKVVYTGDFRINTQDLSKNDPFRTSVKKIDALYLDTTFCSKVYNEFPPREKGEERICELIKDWIGEEEDKKKNVIKLRIRARYGSENLFEQIFKTTGKPVHVFEDTLNVYESISDMAGAFTGNDTETKVHTELYQCRCCDISTDLEVRTIKPLAWKNYYELCFKDEKEKNSFLVCYSHHASYSEIKQLVSYMKPSRIEACVVPPNDIKEKTKEELRKELIDLLVEMMSEYTERRNIKICPHDDHYLAVESTAEEIGGDGPKSEKQPRLDLSPSTSSH